MLKRSCNIYIYCLHNIGQDEKTTKWRVEVYVYCCEKTACLRGTTKKKGVEV